MKIKLLNGRDWKKISSNFLLGTYHDVIIKLNFKIKIVTREKQMQAHRHCVCEQRLYVRKIQAL